MRLFRAGFVLALTLLTVGFQAAPGPFVLCISKCEIAETGQQVEMVCWSGPSESGCCMVDDRAQCAGAADAKVDMGCCVADASCPPFESCPRSPKDFDGTCPYGQPECFFCLPGRIVAENSSKNSPRHDELSRLVAVQASTDLAQTDSFWQLNHSHSPPGLMLAESGPTICIVNCLLLI